MTLTEFLLARIAEDEAVARSGFSGQADPENGWGAKTSPSYGGVTIVPHVGHIHEAVQAAHVVRWNPARVLAECAAKRRIVGRHSVIEVVRHEDRAGMDDIPFCSHCGTDLDDGECPDLLNLASVYADHPDFDEAWRP